MVEENEAGEKNAHRFLWEVINHLKQLAADTDKVRCSEFFQQYLEIMSKFWKYSYHNQLLIAHQMPDATKIAGFRKWREMGRWVRKGSKGIRILAPRLQKITELDKSGKLIEKEEAVDFFPVSVFDISQTEGEPLPEVEITISGDNCGGYLDSLVDFCHARKIKVSFKELHVNGLYGYSKGGQIAITSTESINTQVNTLIHEIAHELLHRGIPLSKQQREIQAEGVAYVVTKHFGIENRSFNYLALYSANYKKIMESLKAIAGASKEIIGFLEGRINNVTDGVYPQECESPQCIQRHI